jgi:small subunit ribosomal protein S4e
LVLRDILKFAQTEKEAKRIVSQGKVQVNGRVIRTDKFPIGLMDVVSIPDIDKHFLVLPFAKGLMMNPVDKEQTSFKLSRIEDKQVVQKGHVQLNLHDGANILVKIADLKNPQEDVYETLDTLKVSLADGQVLGQAKIKEKGFAIVTGGKNIGKHGRIVEIEKATGKKRRNAIVTIEDGKGNRFQTILDFVFSVGETEPLIALPEEA